MHLYTPIRVPVLGGPRNRNFELGGLTPTAIQVIFGFAGLGRRGRLRSLVALFTDQTDRISILPWRPCELGLLLRRSVYPGKLLCWGSPYVL